MATLNLVPPRVQFTDPRTGTISREWYRFFVDLFNRSGGQEALSVSDIETALAMDGAFSRSEVIDQDYTALPIVPGAESLDSLFDRSVAFPAQDVEPLFSRPASSHGGWADLLTDISAGRGIGANTPTWTTLNGGIKAYSFSASAMNEVWLNIHIPHDYLWGSKVFPHIHWTTTGTNTGVCRWGLEYSFARGYGADAFPATTTIYIEQAASGTALTHMIAEPAEVNGITLAGAEPDAVMMCRLFRDAAHVNDTLTDAAFPFFADLHYQSDGFLTNERNRTFTKRRD